MLCNGFTCHPELLFIERREEARAAHRAASITKGVLEGGSYRASDM